MNFYTEKSAGAATQLLHNFLKIYYLNTAGNLSKGWGPLLYFRARYYDAELGRFIGRDPIGYVDGMSLYAGYFVPMGMDPSGTLTCSEKWQQVAYWLGQELYWQGQVVPN